MKDFKKMVKMATGGSVKKYSEGGDIVEEAKTVRPIALGVMSGRPHRAKTREGLAAHYGVAHGQPAAHRIERHLEGFIADRGVTGVQAARAALDRGARPFDIVVCVHQLHKAVFGHFWFDFYEALIEGFLAEPFVDRRQAFGAFGMSPSRVMLHVYIIIKIGCFTHRGASPFYQL